MQNHFKIFPYILAAVMLSVASAAQKPNILLVLVDDMGYSDLGCFGGEIQTPNLDKLGAEGIKFTQFSNNAKCETSRTALMSGRYHVEEGVSKGNGVITIP